MSFFTKSTGDSVEQTTEFTNTGLQALIPDGTQLLCAIAGASWEPESQFKGKTVKVMLHVIQAGKFKDFIVNDSLKLFDNKASVADKALEKLMCYDAICSGQLYAADKNGKPIQDNNELLARALNGGEVLVTFAEYSIDRDDGTKITGNWVRGINAKPKSAPKAAAPVINYASEDDALADVNF